MLEYAVNSFSDSVVNRWKDAADMLYVQFVVQAQLLTTGQLRASLWAAGAPLLSLVDPLSGTCLVSPPFLVTCGAGLCRSRQMRMHRSRTRNQYLLSRSGKLLAIALPGRQVEYQPLPLLLLRRSLQSHSARACDGRVPN